MISPGQIIRVWIKKILDVEGDIKRFSASGRANEQFNDREYFQHYGFSSIPLEKAEGIAFVHQNKVYLIGSDDKRYRVRLEEGEVAIYTDEGDYIKLGRGNKIYIKSSGEVNIQANNVKILSGNIECGDGVLETLLKSSAAQIYNMHTHQVGSATSSPPSQLISNSNYTSKLKGA